MSRSRLKTEPITLMNAELVCLREEINASQWQQVRDRLSHMRSLVTYIKAEDSRSRQD